MLIDRMDDYLALRRALGYKLATEGYLLRSFARFSSRNGPAAFVEATIAVEWAAGAPTPASRERRLAVVARFARHARSEDRRHEIPPADAFGHHPSKRRPHIYSPDEIGALLGAAARLGPVGSIRPHTYVTLFGLLAATGLRVSEALALRVDDLGADGLRILETKFRKSRLVPLHKTTAAALDRYVERRRHVGPSTDNVFLTISGRALKYSTVRRAFTDLRQEALRFVEGRPLPRIHDLRHTFAVRALEAAPRGARLLGRHMRALSTYMGHVSFVSTYWYLHATPLLMRRVADACESIFDGETP